MSPIFINIIGILAILLVAFLLSTGKRRIKVRVVGAAFALQTLMLFSYWPRAAGVP